MVRNIDCNTVFRIQGALNALYNSGIRLKIVDAAKLVQIKGTVDRQADAITDRIVEAIPGLKDLAYVMGDDEREIYTAILSSEVEFDNMDVTLDSFTMDDAARLDMPTVNILMSVF